jgi:hypothetical protein
MMPRRCALLIPAQRRISSAVRRQPVQIRFLSSLQRLTQGLSIKISGHHMKL